MVKTLGILGGMGPLATIRFYEKVVMLTKAWKDQEHIPAIIFSNAKIPDRTESIIQNKPEGVLRELRKSLRLLRKSGADIIAMPCNTSHYYLERINDGSIIDMLEETAKQAKKRGLKTAVVLATTGTVQSRLFDRYFERKGIMVEYPKEQEAVMNAITAIKKGQINQRARLEKIMRRYDHSFILGCTELSIIFERKKNIIDPMDALARACIKKCGKKVKTQSL